MSAVRVRSLARVAPNPGCALTPPGGSTCSVFDPAHREAPAVRSLLTICVSPFTKGWAAEASAANVSSNCSPERTARGVEAQSSEGDTERRARIDTDVLRFDDLGPHLARVSNSSTPLR